MFAVTHFFSYVKGNLGSYSSGKSPVTARKTACISVIKRERDSERVYCTEHFGARLD